MENIQYGKYPSILNVFKHDSETGKILYGVWSCPEFEWLRYCQWDFFEKIDGVNTRVIIENGELSRRGRIDKTQMPEKLLRELNNFFEPHVDKYDSVCFYGEGYGAGIQKGGKYQEEQRFILFDVKFGKYYAIRPTVEKIAAALMLDVVPHVFSGTLQDGINVVSRGLCSDRANTSCFAEGLVGRPRVPLYTRLEARIQVKIKHRDFYPKDGPDLPNGHAAIIYGDANWSAGSSFKYSKM